jgi:hypothetical protein
VPSSIFLPIFQAVYLMKKNSVKVIDVRKSLRDNYFHPKKRLSAKDDVFLRMLECCQRTCYVITDPSLIGMIFIYVFVFLYLYTYDMNMCKHT